MTLSIYRKTIQDTLQEHSTVNSTGQSTKHCTEHSSGHSTKHSTVHSAGNSKRHSKGHSTLYMTLYRTLRTGQNTLQCTQRCKMHMVRWPNVSIKKRCYIFPRNIAPGNIRKIHKSRSVEDQSKLLMNTASVHYGFNTRYHVIIPEFSSYKIILNHHILNSKEFLNLIIGWLWHRIMSELPDSVVAVQSINTWHCKP